MAFKLFKEESFVSPGSMGGKIKKFREMRGWSQKVLGQKCGFSESSADVRIGQYEKNAKVPRERVVKSLAAALNIDEYALFDADMSLERVMYHALFEMEDYHGLHPVYGPDGYSLRFDGSTIGSKALSFMRCQEFLEQWYNMRQKCLCSDSDNAEKKDALAMEYAIWRSEYPTNVMKESAEEFQDRIKREQLQDQIDILDAKKYSASELAKIDEALSSVMPSVKSSHKPIKKESDLVYLIKDVMEKGLDLLPLTPSNQLLGEHDNQQLFSLKSKDISEDTNKARLLADLTCGLEDLQKYGIEITRIITAHKEKLYVTYMYSSSDINYFQNVWKSWYVIQDIINRKDSWPDSELQKLEDKLKESITGKNDIIFSNIKKEDN